MTTKAPVQEMSNIATKIFNKILEASAPVRALADVVRSLAIDITGLAAGVETIAHNQQALHQMIMQLADAITKMNAARSDIGTMPDINNTKPSDKPN